MQQVMIPKTEYNKLKQQALAFRQFAAKFFELSMQDPIQEVVEDFRKTGLYTEEFLRDLNDGLRESSYENRALRAA